MLSTAGEPSCSFTNPAPVTATDQEQPPGESAPPKFSIRNYAFAARSKNIKNSWPFHPRTLKHCVKLGISEPLPSYETLDVIKARLTGGVDLGVPFKCVEVGCGAEVRESLGDGKTGNDHSHCRVNEQPVIPIDNGDDDDTPKASLSSSNAEASPCREFIGPATSVPDDLDLLIAPSQKRGRFLVKLNSSTDQNHHSEEPVSNSSSGSDPMASKTTCPVCKVFASTSNTTLNAHMDQCLAMETSTKPMEEQILKPKVRPRKKRLMVDIYKTAKRCTLEDLDRRNGTNWAELASSAATNKEAVCAENHSPDVLSLEKKNSEREGAVYVDSNGIKIRILSKSAYSPPSVSLEGPGIRKFAKEKAKKGLTIIIKGDLKHKLVKNKKLKLHAKKHRKPVPVSHQSNQNQEDPREDASEEMQQLKLPSVEVATEEVDLVGIESGTPRRQSSFKRTDLSKKSGTRTFLKASDNNAVLGITEPADSDSDNSLVDRRRAGVSSQSAQGVAGSSKNTVDRGWHDRNRSFVRWSSAVASVGDMLRRKVKNSGMDDAGRSYGISRSATAEAVISLPAMKGHMSSASDREFRLRDKPSSTEGAHGDLSQKLISALKFRKHRSLMSSKKAHRPDCVPEAGDEHVAKRLRLGSSSSMRANQDADNGDAENESVEREAVQCDHETPGVQVDTISRMEPDSSSARVVLDDLPSTSSRVQSYEMPNEQLMLRAPVPTAGFTARNDDAGFEGPQDSSSITSNREYSSHGDAGTCEKGAESGPSPRNIRPDTEAGHPAMPNAKDEATQYCCSCRSSAAGAPQVSKKKHVPSLYIGPRASSSFSSYRSSVANPKANSDVESGIRSSAGSLNISTDEGSLNPFLQAQIPSPSNPILRLMGKNLTVTSNTEIIGHPQTQNQDYFMRGKYADPLGFGHGNYAIRSDSSPHQHLGDPAFLSRFQSLTNNQMPHSMGTIQAGSFPHVPPPSEHGLMLEPDPHYQHKAFRSMLPFVQVITTDSSPEACNGHQRISFVLPNPSPPARIPQPMAPPVLPPRPFFCLPMPSQAYQRHVPVVPAPLYSSLGPSQGGSSDAPGHLSSGPFFAPPTPGSYVSPSVYYSSQNLHR